MPEVPEPEFVQVNIEVSWPPDTYTDAMPINSFVFNDMGENLCFAFGFVPPPPGVENLVQDPGFSLQAERIRAVLIPKSMVPVIASTLKRFIDDNPMLFGVGEDQR